MELFHKLYLSQIEYTSTLRDRLTELAPTWHFLLVLKIQFLHHLKA